MLTDKIEEILKERNSNITALAKETGIPQQTISSWKSGKKPSIDKIKIICEHLGISADYLLEIRPREPDVLDPQECALLEQFRRIEDDVGREIVLELTRREASRYGPPQEQEKLYNSKIG